MSEKTKYQSTVTNRFYPGRISAERAGKLANFQVNVDEVGVDDIVHYLARSRTIDLHTMVDMVRRKWGEEGAKTFAYDWARQRAKGGMQTWLRLHNVKHGNPHLMAVYQDLMHGLGGPSHSTTYSSYDDEKCVVTRTGCAYHTFKPEALPSACPMFTEGHIRGYMDADPALVRSEKPACIGLGDDHCTRIFYYQKMD